MNLVCPHCAKVVDIPQDMAGKTTTCPSCSGPFTVPLVPPEMLTAMSTPKENKDEAKLDPLAKADEKPGDNAPPPTGTPTKETAGPGNVPAIFHASTTVPSHQPGSAFRLVIALSRDALPFIAPTCLLILMALLFLPWVGVYAGHTPLVEQSGFGVTFGTGTKHDKVESLDEVGWSGYMLLHFLCLLFGLLAVLGALVAKHAPPNLRAKMQKFGPVLMEQRPLILGVFTLLAFLCLLMLLFVNLPLEKTVTGKQAEPLQKKGMEIKFGMAAPEKVDTDLLESQWLRRSSTYGFALVLSLVAVLAALADLRCTRFPHRPLPHVEIVWGGNTP